METMAEKCIACIANDARMAIDLEHTCDLSAKPPCPFEPGSENYWPTSTDNPTLQSEKLEPCPFCGGKATLKRVKSSVSDLAAVLKNAPVSTEPKHYWWIGCEIKAQKKNLIGCGVGHSAWSQADAITKWNTRRASVAASQEDVIGRDDALRVVQDARERGNADLREIISELKTLPTASENQMICLCAITPTARCPIHAALAPSPSSSPVPPEQKSTRYKDRQAHYAAIAAANDSGRCGRQPWACRYQNARQCAHDSMLGAECPKVCGCECHNPAATPTPVEQEHPYFAHARKCKQCGPSGFCSEGARLYNATPSHSVREAAEDPHCWHCGVVLAYAPKLRCEDCPDECDKEGCDEIGCVADSVGEEGK